MVIMPRKGLGEQRLYGRANEGVWGERAITNTKNVQKKANLTKFFYFIITFKLCVYGCLSVDGGCS